MYVLPMTDREAPFFLLPNLPFLQPVLAEKTRYNEWITTHQSLRLDLAADLEAD